jgi:hypothetical protein
MGTATINYGLEKIEENSNQTRTDLEAPRISVDVKYSPMSAKGSIAHWLPAMAVVSFLTGSVKDFDHIKRLFQQDTLSSSTVILQPLQQRQYNVQIVPTIRKPIWMRIQEAFSHVPDEELEAWPKDGAAQVDHYLYGAAKR